MEKILVVEDDLELSRALAYLLENNQFEVVCAFSVMEARKRFDQKTDLILLDVNLPDGDGFLFCKMIRQQSDVPIIFLTARDMEEDVLAGYDCGAEDYITKPFSMKILLKKIDVVMKRTVRESSVFDDGFLMIDFSKTKITVKGAECSITPTEFRILQELFLHKGQVLTYEILLEKSWEQGNQFVDKHALAVNINRLRKKIEDEEHRYITNIYGMGYQWVG